MQWSIWTMSVILFGLMYGHVLSCLPTPADRIIVSEVNDKTGNTNVDGDDIGEFIEVRDPAGAPNASMDGFCVVTWLNGGATNEVDEAEVLDVYSLDGYYTNSKGFLVIGGEALLTDSSGCCADDPFGFYLIDEPDFLPDGGGTTLVIGIYYGGCNLTEGQVYTANEVHLITQNLIDAIPTSANPVEFLNLFNEDWTTGDFETLSSQNKAYARCGLSCLDQFSPTSGCFDAYTPTPGTATNCKTKGNGK